MLNGHWNGCWIARLSRVEELNKKVQKLLQFQKTGENLVMWIAIYIHHQESRCLSFRPAAFQVFVYVALRMEGKARRNIQSQRHLTEKLNLSQLHCNKTEKNYRNFSCCILTFLGRPLFCTMLFCTLSCPEPTELGFYDCTIAYQIKGEVPHYTERLSHLPTSSTPPHLTPSFFFPGLIFLPFSLSLLLIMTQRCCLIGATMNSSPYWSSLQLYLDFRDFF